MSRIIEFTIKDGEISTDLKGFNGVGCKALASKFDFGTVTKEVIKPEFHNSEESSNEIKVRA